MYLLYARYVAAEQDVTSGCETNSSNRMYGRVCAASPCKCSAACLPRTAGATSTRVCVPGCASVRPAPDAHTLRNVPCTLHLLSPLPPPSRLTHTHAHAPHTLQLYSVNFRVPKGKQVDLKNDIERLQAEMD